MELHSFDQGEIRAAGDAIFEHVQAEENSRLKPKILSSEIITGMDDYQAMLINRMRHGQFILKGETLYVLEVHPAGMRRSLPMIAEKAARSIYWK